MAAIRENKKYLHFSHCISNMAAIGENMREKKSETTNPLY